jgi:hypothetical protein
MPARAIPVVILVAAGFIGVVALVVFVGYGGFEYYRAPLGTRGYLPQHKWLRPSGTVGLTLGAAGTLAMIATLPYFVRKRWRVLAGLGSLKTWLEVHIFFGIVGPLLITLHTSFKFNGLISVGYWLMMTVWASGFVGRYLYGRIPRSIRGTELTRDEITAGFDKTRARLAELPLPPEVRREIDTFHSAAMPEGRAPGAFDLFFGELRVRFRLKLLRRELARRHVELNLVHDAVALAAQRAAMTRRLAHLERTRRLFEMWHVFHRPLVALVFVIVAIHVGVALYLGYAQFWAEAS